MCRKNHNENTPIQIHFTSANDIRSSHANINLFFNSFLHSTVRACNDLPDNVKEASTVSSFKYRLNRDLRAPPKYFNAGSRIGQILQGRLRMECSSLNSDLFRKNIVPSPSCSCGGFESAFHFSYTTYGVNNVSGLVCFKSI